MTHEDRDLLQRFESCTLAGPFRHEDHVRVTWLYLQRDPCPTALDEITRGIKRLAASAGKPDLYHATITWAYVLLVNERIERTGRDVSWNEFASQNADLLTYRPSILRQLYQDETLASDLARRVFVLPDRSRQP